jgi:serine/threonine protein kinase
VVALPGFLKIDLRNFSIQEVIAKGGTAIVMKGRLKPEENIAEDVLNRFKNQDIVAIKIMKRPPAIPEDEFVRSVHQEISIMYAMETYPNIIQLLAFCEKPFAIITKLYAGNLSSELKNAADLKWNNELIKLNMAYDVAKGISYLHDNGIIHNDLKPANILIEFDLLDKEKERPIGVISDFGISGLLEEDVKGRNKSNVIGASVAYAAPEILILQDDSSMTQDKIGSVQSDLYSYAMILYELVTRNPPFKNYSVNSVLRDAIISGDRPVLIQSEREHHPFLVTLIEANWQQSAKSRMQSFADVLSLLDAAMSRTMQQ